MRSTVPHDAQPPEMVHGYVDERTDERQHERSHGRLHEQVDGHLDTKKKRRPYTSFGETIKTIRRGIFLLLLLICSERTTLLIGTELVKCTR